MVSSYSNTSSDDEDYDVYKTPKKTKRRYRRTIHNGPSKRMVRYHRTEIAQEPNIGNVMIHSDFSPSQISKQTHSSSSSDEYSCLSNTSTTATTSTTSEEDEQCTDTESETTCSTATNSNIEDVESSDDYITYSDEDFENIQDCHDFDDDEIYPGCKLSRKASYTMVMIFVSRYKLPKSGFNHLLQLLDAHMPDKSNYCTSVYKIKEKLKKYMDFKKPVIQNFCEKCQQLLEDGGKCERKECSDSSANILEFHDLQPLEQLNTMFKDSCFINALQSQRGRLNEFSELGDISKTRHYFEFVHGEKEADLYLTLTMNTDGVALFTSSRKGSLWPVYLAINELPIKLRFARMYLIVGYLHCQVEKPNMVTYLTPLMNALKELYDPGLKVVTSDGSVIHVRAKLMLMSVDLPARALVLNMRQFNGKHGCCFCLDEGQSPAGQPMLRFYPFQESSAQRTQQSMLIDARKAVMEKDVSRGIKGVNPLMMLNYFDIPSGVVIDWMHNVLLGVTKALLTFWLNSKHKNKMFFIGDKIDLLNKRYLKIKIPGYVARRPRTLHDHTHWKATEFREWLIHFSVPVLNGVLDWAVYVHFLLLVTSLYLLTKDDLDSVALSEARKLLFAFCRIFPSIYGKYKLCVYEM